MCRYWVTRKKKKNNQQNTINIEVYYSRRGTGNIRWYHPPCFSTCLTLVRYYDTVLVLVNILLSPVSCVIGGDYIYTPYIYIYFFFE